MSFLHRIYSTMAIFGLFLLFGCFDKHQSGVDASNIPSTGVKKQVENNCWAYATISWIESMHMMTANKKIDLSESYLTYWRIYRGLLEQKQKDQLIINYWVENAFEIITQRGVLAEQDFSSSIPYSSTGELEAQAVAYINDQMKPGGTLYVVEDRSDELVVKELDKAFGIDMASLLGKAIPANQFIFDRNSDGQTITLEQAMVGSSAWVPAYPARIYEGDTVATEADDLKYIQRMQRAINDHKPFIITYQSIFASLYGTGDTYDYDLIPSEEADGPGPIAELHAAVAIDYVADDVPGVGTVGEGEVSGTDKIAALEGKLRYIKIKNSWGAGTSGPFASNTTGYYKLNRDYLFKPLPRSLPDDVKIGMYYTILPPGY